MTWDLWSSPYDSWDLRDSPNHQEFVLMLAELNACLSVAPGSTYGTESGWEYNFYFGCGCDLIEEDAINEKCCILVLKILITKADTEIDELEKDLVALQSSNGSPTWDRLVFNKIKEKLGGRVHFMGSGASPLSPNVMDFLRVDFLCHEHDR
ncbi:hypothetical protein L3X38_026764 [Prunus dulcis]|uniref:Uncharacterized protein n=1 Tax=Prunus dulcis TaxID=3755 RepID=A0AAD4Z0I1_PRUDU|nr:hypothetical protein L3X38_026764 [Prunus dulcis]